MSKNIAVTGKTMLLLLAGLSVSSISSGQQCLSPSGWAGCQNTDLSNSFMNSNNNAATIEYDNWGAGLHTSVVRKPDGSFYVWGQSVGSDGDASVAVPSMINSTLYPGLTGTVLKVSLGGNSQLIILTTDGLWVVGRAGESGGENIGNTAMLVFRRSSDFGQNGVVTTKEFQKITNTHLLNADASTGLPPGVTPSGVKMMFATSRVFAITTCDGAVWVATAESGWPRGANISTTSGANTFKNWYRVVKDAANTPLSNIVACRGAGESLFALDASGNLWTWGTYVYLGTGAEADSRAFKRVATQMTLPPLTGGERIKMIGGTRVSNQTADASSRGMSYYVLTTAGKLWALGANEHKQLGIWSAADSSRTWKQPMYESASTPGTAGEPMNNIKWISPAESYVATTVDYAEGAACINVLTDAGTLYNWGNNKRGMLGRASTAGASPVDISNKEGGLFDPGIPTSGSGTHSNAYALTGASTFTGVKTGGHTSMLLPSCHTSLLYAGHRVGGSMGDGNDFPDENQYFFTNNATPAVTVCGANAVTMTTSASAICNGVPFTVNVSPAGGTFFVNSMNADMGTPGTFTAAAGNDNPVEIEYLPASACSLYAAPLILYKRDFGNLPTTGAVTWPNASATILGTNRAWLGGTSATTGRASADCSSSLSDATDGFSLAGVSGGNGTSSSPWIAGSGTNCTATVTINGDGASKRVYWAIWYDANGDGDFIDANDNFYSGSAVHNSPASSNFTLTVPSAGGGTTGRVRVVATAVNTFFTKDMNGEVSVVNGEVEDYYISYPVPLPVGLHSFTAQKNGSGALLSWTLEDENANGIGVQHSNDGQLFTELAILETNISKYVHIRPAAGKNYYRLRITRKDGSDMYTTARQLYFGTPGGAITVFPNPVKDRLTVNGIEAGTIVRVIDMMGRVLSEQHVADNFGINVANLHPGIYQLQAVSNDGTVQAVRFTHQ